MFDLHISRSFQVRVRDFSATFYSHPLPGILPFLKSPNVWDFPLNKNTLVIPNVCKAKPFRYLHEFTTNKQMRIFFLHYIICKYVLNKHNFVDDSLFVLNFVLYMYIMTNKL